jgi:hypothetical protein
MRHRARTHKTFGAHVCLAPNSGVRADIPGPPLWARTGHSISSSAQTHHAYSGSPALRRPSISSFKFDALSRASHTDTVKSGLSSSARAAAASCLIVASEMSESGREKAVTGRKGGVVTKGFLPCDDGLVKATKFNKGLRHSGKHRV